MSSALDKVEENIFQLTSEDIIHNNILPNKQVYKGYGCDGGNTSPELTWHNPPSGTQSFAIICHDPDAPKENGWYHWLVLNINKNISSIKPNEKIEGAIETITDFNKTGYDGACPPVGHGIHHYNFTVYALDVEKLDISATTKPKEVEEKILEHTIAKTTITGIFERK